MDRVVLYLSYSRVDGIDLAWRVAEELRGDDIPPALVPDPNGDGRPDLATLALCDAVLLLLTPSSAVEDPAYATELLHAAASGRNIIPIRAETAIVSPVPGPGITFPERPSRSDREALRQRFDAVRSPQHAGDERRRAWALWRATAPWPPQCLHPASPGTA